MKKIVTVILCALAMGVVMPQAAMAEKKEKKEKVKKEKKPYEWTMPELSGNETVDQYLLECDTIYNRIRTYSDSITFYKVKKGIVKDKKTGEMVEVMGVFDEEGNYRSSGKALLQYIDLALKGTSLIGDMAVVTTGAAAATVALPNLGLKALSYGKYVKAGPKIAQMGAQEIGEIVKLCNEQKKQIRALRKGYDEEGKLKKDVDPSNIDGVDLTKTETVEIEDPDKFWAQVEAAKQEDAGISDPEEI